MVVTSIRYDFIMMIISLIMVIINLMLVIINLMMVMTHTQVCAVSGLSNPSTYATFDSKVVMVMMVEMMMAYKGW